MGATSADRQTNQSGGLDGDTLGATGGAETHTLTESEMPAHTHKTHQVPLVPQTTHLTVQQVHFFGTDHGLQVAETAHNNVQPTIVLNYIIKT